MRPTSLFGQILNQIRDKTAEGLVLAESGVGDRAEALGAIVPRMLRQMSENMAEIDEEGVQSVTIRIKGRMHTIMASDRIYLVALHEANRLTMKHFPDEV